MTIFADGLLADLSVAFAGAPTPQLLSPLAQLGARLEVLADLGDEEAESWARSRAPLALLVVDARGHAGEDAFRMTVDSAWSAVRAIAVGAMIPARRGKIVFVSPPARSGPHAEPARAALENTARTLSVEWARYAITTTAIAPGPRTSEEQIATLLAYLASPAGDYLSGCRLDLGLI